MMSRFVERVRVLAFDRVTRIARLPDGRTSLVFRVLDGALGGDLGVSGPRSRALFKRSTGVARAISIELKPGWAMQVLGVPARALTDRIVRLHELWGAAGAELCDQLLAARDAPEILERVSAMIDVRAAHVVEPASVRMLETEAVPIASVAQRLGVSPRHLRRAFAESVGVGPKDFARAVRLNRVVERAAGGAPDWSRIAADTGYYDQAHLISDFRALVGITPGAFRANAAP